MATATDAARLAADHLRLSQWLSPSFPVSAYAYAHGLETEMAAGRVASSGDLHAWLETVIARGAGAADATMLCAVRQGADPDTVADVARALAGSRERLEETEAQGAALAATLDALGVGDGVARPYPVTLGLSARGLSLSDLSVAALFLQSFAANLVSAAVRFVPLGQVEGQRVIQDLHPVLLSVAETATAGDLDGIGTAAFGADLAAMAHETLDVRLFRT